MNTSTHRSSSSLVVLALGLLCATACDPEGGPAAPETIELRSGPSCGDGVLDPTELCDDGNLDNDDGCDATCTPSGIAAVTVGQSNACALTLAGSVKCWGQGDRGQLGRGDTVTIGDDETPQAEAFVALEQPAQQIGSNGQQSFTLTVSGSVLGWGSNGQFELGLLHTEDLGDDETPAGAVHDTEVTLGSPAAQLAVGGSFACARLFDGTVSCWGDGGLGQLGYGSDDPVGDDETPESVGSVPLGGLAVDLAAGADHACAVLEDGTLRCWGANGSGQLGLGHTQVIGDNETPELEGAVALEGKVLEVVAGLAHTCVLLEGGRVQCWGDGGVGATGHGDTRTIGDDELAASVGDLALGGTAVGLTAGRRHTCARLDTGALRCWGNNDAGQLGLGHTQAVGDDEVPAEARALEFGGVGVLGVYAGPLARSTCALLETGSLRCWGDNDAGQLGLGHLEAMGDSVTESPGNLPDIAILVDEDF